MDNFHFDITSDGDITPAMKLAFGEYRNRVWHRRASAFIVDPAKGLVFFWSNTQAISGMGAFPFEMDGAGAADFATRWLAQAKYPKEPDHDGHNVKGWHLYNEAWGRVGGMDLDWTYSFAAVLPAWAEMGK